MARFSALLVLSSVLSVAALHDVPKGECYNCEVTCFEDCALKYDREIIQMDVFLQTSKGKENKTTELTSAYGECLVDDKCPCRAQAAAQGKSKAVQLLASDKKGKCAANTVPCSAKCAQKALAKTADTKAKLSLLESFSQSMGKKDFPLHAVKLNVFAKGGMVMDQCLKYCLAATCGCQDAPGFAKRADTVKANSVAGGVTDTPGSPQYRPAKIEECAKGMIGKKVAKGLYIKLGGGPLDYAEVCTPGFLSAVAAPEGAEAKCKSGASDDSKFGCVWNAQKNMCVVGFSPILKCMTQYVNDPTP
jgi:hypothetical protein